MADPDAGFLLGCLAWVGFTLLPIAALVRADRLASWLAISWLRQVAFLPLLLSAEWMFSSMLFFAARDNGEGPPGLGLLMIPGFIALLILVVVFVSMEVVIAAKWLRDRPR